MNTFAVRKSTLLMIVIVTYSFLAPLGNLARFGNHEGAFGVTTILLLVLVLGGLTVLPTVFSRERVFQALLLLILWLIAASIFAAEPLGALLNGGSLLVYLGGAMLAYHAFSSPDRVLLFLKTLCLAGLIGSLVTIIDFLGFLNFPGVNEQIKGTRTEHGHILRASGMFYRRTAMAAYYVLIITMGLGFALFATRMKRSSRFFFFLAAVSCFIALALTHNRSGVIAPMLALVIVYSLRASNPLQLIRVGLSSALSLGVIAIVVVQIFPDLWFAYKHILSIGSDAPRAASDALRWEFAKHAIASLASNPLGHGYSWLVGTPSYGSVPVDPHNILTQVIWGAGFIGILWLVVIGWWCRKVFVLMMSRSLTRSLEGQLWLVMVAALVAFFLNSMMHTSISTGVAWFLFGGAVRLTITVREKHRVLNHHNSNTAKGRLSEI